MGRSATNSRRIFEILEYHLFLGNFLASAIQERGLFNLNEENNWADVNLKRTRNLYTKKT